MRQEFVGRSAELRTLEDAFVAETSAFIPIYGRRRVGKTELILRFLRDRHGVYHVGKQTQGPLQLREFLDEAGVALGEPLLASASFDGWRPALAAVVDRWKGRGKLILAFDEFQWTAAASPELPSVLQELWDRGWKQSGRVFLILCGSYVGFMEREVLGRKSPLFGRRTQQILLRPFGYREAALFHPTYSLVDQARTYFVCGGVPWYLDCFDSSRSVETNVARLLLEEHGPLRREPEFLLREELRDVASYYAVLLAVAQGHVTARDISRTTGIGNRGLHYYVQQLVELGYLRRRYPLSERRAAARHVRFAIEDPLLRFWFRFVFPNTSFIVQMGSARAMSDRVRPALDAYWGGCFEAVCREALPRLYEREGVDASFDVGEYWDKECQIDVVGVRKDGWVDIGECKWGAVRSPRQLVGEIDAKVERFPNRRGATICRRLFTREASSAAARKVLPDGVRWHDLQDIYR